MAGPESRETTERSRQVLTLLRRIIRSSDLRSKRLAKSTGLTIPQIVVLQAISDLGEVTAGKISEYVSLSPATVSTILDRLENRGFVERYRSARDRRVVHSSLTRTGRAALANLPPLLHERFIRRFEQLGPARQAGIIEALENVADMMQANEPEPADLDPAEFDSASVLDLHSPAGGEEVKE